MKKHLRNSTFIISLAVSCMFAGLPVNSGHAVENTDSMTGAAYIPFQLNECLNAVKANPHVIRRHQLETDIANKSLTAVKADKRPVITAFTAGTISSRQDTTAVGATDTLISRENIRAGVDIDYTLYDAGANKASVNAAKSNIDEVDATYHSLVLDLLDNAASTFYTVLYYQRIEEVDNDKIASLNENLRAAKGRFDIGTVTKSDLLNAQSALSLAVAVKEENQQSLYEARVKLANLVGLDPEKKLPVVIEPSQSAPISETITQLSDATLMSHPDIQKAKALQNNAAAELDLAKSQDKIHINLNSSMGIGMRYHSWDLSSGNSDPYIAAVVRVQMPLYNGGKDKALQQRQEANIKLQELLTQDIQNQLKEKILGAYSAYKTAELKIKPSLDAVTAAEEAYKLAKGRYTAALGTQRDVLDALHQLTLNRLTLAQNTYNRDLAINNLRRLAGMDHDLNSAPSSN